jgi:hypothetical protein
MLAAKIERRMDPSPNGLALLAALTVTPVTIT